MEVIIQGYGGKGDSASGKVDSHGFAFRVRPGFPGPSGSDGFPLRPFVWFGLGPVVGDLTLTSKSSLNDRDDSSVFVDANHRAIPRVNLTGFHDPDSFPKAVVEAIDTVVTKVREPVGIGNGEHVRAFRVGSCRR